MICESGRVVSLEDNWVWVETHRTSSCQSCSAKSGCGQSLINSVFSGKRHYVKVALNDFKGKVNLHDDVEIAIPEHVMLRGSVLLYMLPLASMIAGAVSGQHFFTASGDIATIAGTITGFLASALFIRWHSYKNSANPAYQPVLHRIVRSVALLPIEQPIVFQS